MTVEEFKKKKPELAHLEGDMLLNAMEDYVLRQQEGYAITKIVLPFWKRYTFRWLFYRKTKNWSMQKGDYTSPKRCAVCKRPTGMLWGIGGKLYCHGHEYKEELNTSVKHRVWVIYCKISTIFWLSLDWLHIVRSTYDSRYGMFGDENQYVDHWTMNMETGEMKFILKKRKWWQYIFVERKFKI